MAEYLFDVERFWSYVAKGEGCWNWQSACDAYGYGRLHGFKDGKNWSLLAHRLSFTLANGYTPQCVLHRCDNRRCVNPAHLFGGDRAANNRDMTLKGRHAAHNGNHNARAGSRHPQAKLTESDVPVIKGMYAAGARQRDIGARYGVSQRTIAKIVNNIGWTHA